MVGPGSTLLEGIVGEGVTIGPDKRPDMRESTISYELAKRLLYTRFSKPGEPAPMHLFYALQRVVRRWLDGGYLECTGNTQRWMVATYQEVADKACELIDLGLRQR
jgi:type III restriction enzyme